MTWVWVWTCIRITGRARPPVGSAPRTFVAAHAGMRARRDGRARSTDMPSACRAESQRLRRGSHMRANRAACMFPKQRGVGERIIILPCRARGRSVIRIP